MKRKPRLTKADIEKFDEENELWDSRKLGASAEFAVRSSEEEDKGLDQALGLQLLSFRIQKSVVESLKQIASLEGIGYQPLMRQVLTKYVRDNQHRLESHLSPKEAAEQAEQHLIQAIEYRGYLATREPMTQGRIIAEGDYAKALDSANSLFKIALEQSSSPVLKKHAQLRLDQIRELLSEDSIGIKTTKRPKAGKKQAS